MVPSSLLLRYFEIAQGRLQKTLTDDEYEQLLSENGHPNKLLSRHRVRIVEAQLTSLDDAISEWQRRNSDNDVDSSIDREALQNVLRQIGLGDFTSVSHDGKGDEDLLTETVGETNELARQAFARSVLTVEWRRDRQELLPQSRRELRGGGIDEEDCIDEESTLEYCGLMMAAVRLAEVQQFLRDGTMEMEIPHLNRADDELSTVDSRDKTAEDRLLYIQILYWRALGWEPINAIEQLTRLLSGDSGTSSNLGQIIRNAKGIETLTKYASAMTVAVTNAAMAHIGDGDDHATNDGTTRIVSVSYSEKIITVPADGGSSGNATSHSLSAPSSNTIDEHKLSQQRRQLDVAQQASMLQQKIWSEFESLPPRERTATLERAQRTQRDFLERVARTPPGRERVVLMQSMDGEAQKLLLIYKLWCSRNPGAEVS